MMASPLYVTLTVAIAEADPVPPMLAAVAVQVVVPSGLTVTVPDSEEGTVPRVLVDTVPMPLSMMTEAALVADHASVTEPPVLVLVGEAVSVTVVAWLRLPPPPLPPPQPAMLRTRVAAARSAAWRNEITKVRRVGQGLWIRLQRIMTCPSDRRKLEFSIAIQMTEDALN